MNALRPIHLKIACMNLRHKDMYVDERQSVPGLVDDSSDTRVFFCTCTQDSLGPDGAPVSARACKNGRPCYTDSISPQK